MKVEQGFLLSRQVVERHDDTSIILWVKTSDSVAKLCIQAVECIFFTTSTDFHLSNALLTKSQIKFNTRTLKLVDFKMNPIVGFYFKTQSDYFTAVKILQRNGVDLLESDIRLVDRYLMERFVCGSVDFYGKKSLENRYIVYTDARIKSSNFIPRLKTVSLDIECSEKGHLYSIGLVAYDDSRVIMIGQSEKTSDINIEWVNDEKALLEALVVWFECYDPDLVIGWNIVDFDCRLLLRRARTLGVKLEIGRGRELVNWRESSLGNQSFVTVPGRVVIDGISALKTATYSFSSWSLESVGQSLLGKGKAINNSREKMDEINRMFRDDKIALARYNLQDCQLVQDIFEHTQILDFLIQRTKLTGVELDRVGGSVAAFTNLYLPQLHRAGYVAPSLESDDWLPSPGGFVMDSKPGLYSSVLVLDFKSLYPSIIRTFLIDPMGLIEGLNAQDERETVDGFLGAKFHRKKHFLPAMIEQLWLARDEAKKSGQKAFSQAIKIIMNSFYGVLGSSGCRFFDQRLASSITMRGHEIMKTTRRLIEAKNYEVIYGDTDSLFVSLGGKLTNDEADEIGAQLTNEINQWWETQLWENNKLTSYLELEYETHYLTFLMPKIRGQETGSKKRYAGLVERENERKLVFKGLETVRTDWTVLAQEFQQTLYQRIFDGEETVQYIHQIVEDTLSGLNDEKLVYRKRLRRPLSEYKKNVPPHVKAARKADDWHALQGYPLQYQKGGWIAYVITINGPEPVEAIESPLDYGHYVAKQLKPIADGILPFIGTNFETIITPQQPLF